MSHSSFILLCSIQIILISQTTAHFSSKAKRRLFFSFNGLSKGNVRVSQLQ